MSIKAGKRLHEFQKEQSLARRKTLLLLAVEYCLTAILQQLADDNLLEEEQVTIPVNPTLDEEFIASLEALQEKIKLRRKGKPIEIDRIIDEMRGERDDELTGLR